MTTQTATKIEQRGARLYLVGLPFAQKDAAKDALGLTGANFDRDNKTWWCGTAKRAAAEAFVAKLNAAPTPAPTAAGERPKEDPAKVEVKAKAEYKGRSYYVRWHGTTNAGKLSAHLFSLDGFGFWADLNAQGETDPAKATITKVYEAREERGAFGKPTGRYRYQTLAGIASFIARQKNPATARVQCHECGSWHNQSEACRDCGGC